MRSHSTGKGKMIWLILPLLVLAAGALAIPLFVHTGETVNPDGEGSLGGLIPEPLPEVELSITCVGDIMAHETQIKAQYDAAADTYDFDNNFVYVKDYIQQADLALCNVETTFAGGKPTGYPSFNGPDALAADLKEVGFDVAITANNHMLDRGFKGMQRTLDVLRGAGLTTVGSQKAGEKTWTMVEAEGVKIGVTAYTYETTGVNGNRTMNGSAMSGESKELINSFSYNHLNDDLDCLKQDIAEARAEGADIVIAYLHWGEEYQRTPNSWQTKIAGMVADYGADIIFASHPHVLQAVDYVELESRKVPVFYSMGNFISNQRAETLDNRYTEQGMLANVHLTWDQEAKTITEISADVIPTWVDRYKADGKQNYYIIPLDNALNSNETLAVSGHLSRAKQALEDVRTLIGDEWLSLSCPPAQQ